MDECNVPRFRLSRYHTGTYSINRVLIVLVAVHSKITLLVPIGYYCTCKTPRVQSFIQCLFPLQFRFKEASLLDRSANSTFAKILSGSCTR